MKITINLIESEPALLLTLIKNQLKKESDTEMIELLITTRKKIKLGIYQEVVKIK